MPFTPFHFGPSACVALPSRRTIDFPAFLLANVIVDLEPLSGMMFGWPRSYHGVLHSFTVGSLAGIVWGAAAYALRGLFAPVMKFAGIHYQTTLKKAIVSAVLGLWLHVFLDALLYVDLHPFYPMQWNPLLHLISYRVDYLFCAVSFIPAFFIWLYLRKKSL